jgi:RNA recognition motif-containing protein
MNMESKALQSTDIEAMSAACASDREDRERGGQGQAGGDQSEEQLMTNTNLFVGDLSKECSENDLIQLFETVGKVVTASIKKSKTTYKSLGYGFVSMELPEQAFECFKLQGAMLCGRPIRIGWGHRHCQLLVEHLDREVTVAQLNELLSRLQFQPLRINIKRTGKP